jgi:preprotein translocase subunit SecY
MYRQGGSTYIPLRVNMAGMIPLIFAMSLMIFPGTIASYLAAPAGQEPNFANTIMEWFNPSAPLPVGLFYWVFYFALVVGFTFFYTMVIFEQMDLARTLQRQGGFIPGVRPGKPTTDYLNGVINRLTWGGALFLALGNYAVHCRANYQCLGDDVIKHGHPHRCGCGAGYYEAD